MSADQVTVVSSRSWFNRLGAAFKGILVGLLLFVAAFPLLFWNEGRTVKRFKALEEGAGAVVSVSSGTVDAANDGQLVHTTGKADTDEILSDPEFEVSVNALRLRRSVEMYQWAESTQSKTQKKLGGGEETVTTYSYSKKWADSPINSSRFKEPTGHQNPGDFPYSSLEQTANTVTLGAFVLPSSLVRNISRFEDLPVASPEPPPAAVPVETSAVEEAAGESTEETIATDAPPEAPPVVAEPPPPSRFTAFGGGYYVGENPTSPQIGDMKIRFSAVYPQEISVVAKQDGNSFSPYKTKVGGSIQLLQTGTQTAEAMFEQAQQSNQMVAWLLRLLGFILMMAGLNMVFRPLSVVADVLPILGRIVGAGTGLIAFLVAAILSLLTIAIAWIAYRPVLGIALLVVVVGLVVVIRNKMKAAKVPAAPATAPTA